MLLIDDICLHLFQTSFIFYYYELILNQMLIIFIWITIRNQKTTLNQVFIYLYSIALIILSIIYSILFLKNYSKVSRDISSNELEIFLSHELIILAFNIVSISLFYCSHKDIEKVVEDTTVEMIDSNSGLIV